MDTQNNAVSGLVIVERPQITIFDTVLKQLRQTETYTLPNQQFGKIRLVTVVSGSKRAIVLVHPAKENGIQPMNSYVVPTAGGSLDAADFVVFEFTKVSYEFGNNFNGAKVLDFKIWGEVNNRTYFGVRSWDEDAISKGDVVPLIYQDEQYVVQPTSSISAEMLEAARKYGRVFCNRVSQRLPVNDARRKVIASADIDHPYVKFMMQERKIQLNADSTGFVKVKTADRKSKQDSARQLLMTPATPVIAAESFDDDNA